MRLSRELAWLFLATSLAASCGGDAASSRHVPGGGGPPPVTDDAGRVVRLPVYPRRIVSLIPATTEAVIALGAGDRIVARTDYDTQPQLDSLPSVGGGLTPSLEWLVSRLPDLVIAWPDNGSRDVVDRMEAAGLTVYAARPERLTDVRRTLRNLGTLLGRPEAADSMLAAIDAGLDSVRAAVAGLPRPEVLYLESHDPPLVVGSGTYIDDLLGVAGAHNVFADADAPWPQVALEEIVRRQPDVIVLPSFNPDRPDTAWLRTAPGWRALRAVRAGRVHVVPESRFSRPGPGVAAVARQLARLLHPDAPLP